MTHCICNRVLNVDLESRTIYIEPTADFSARFLGGRGVNQKILFERLDPKTKAFDDENLLAFGAGMLVGTSAPCANRLSIDSKSAFSNGIGSANMGGYFAAELKRAGYDGIILKGRSEIPVYLWVHDGMVEFREASAIWMKTTTESETAIRKELGGKNIAIIGIGQAGATLARIACIIGDGTRAAGRCGLGAVMGSKNIKAIAVKGTGKISVADPSAFRGIVHSYSEKLKKTSGAKMRGTYGTIPAVKLFNTWSATPFRNFQNEYMDDEDMNKLAPEVFAAYSEKKLACAFCSIGCQHVYRITDGPYAGLACTKLEANALWNFGTKLDITYPPAVMNAQQLCSEYGLDIDGASSSIAWAMECFEQGILTKADTDSLELRWGDHQVVMELLRKMAYREGFGQILGEGVKVASEHVGRGSEVYALHIKGQDLIEPLRSLKAWALGITVSPRGAAHTRGAAGSITRSVTPEIAQSLWGLEPEMEAGSYEAAPRIVRYYERFHAVLDSLGICFFASNWLGLDALYPDDLAEMVSVASGKNVGVNELMLTGERIHSVEKAFNIRHARFSRREDFPPERLMNEAVKSGLGKGEMLDRKKWEGMLDAYYSLHGWNRETGWPRKHVLIELGLTDVAAILEKEDLLG